MNYQQNGRIVSFIWKIADDVLLPMTVTRRLDAVPEPNLQYGAEGEAGMDGLPDDILVGVE
jgi:hypothetical protein